MGDSVLDISAFPPLQLNCILQEESMYAHGGAFQTQWWIDDQTPDAICIMEAALLITPYKGVAELDPVILNWFVNKLTSEALSSELFYISPSTSEHIWLYLG